ncbi:MAG: hypothetical protein EKK50_16145 [Sphingomonadaceae bacterium]|nr:MAG: hypothetical protein EKK50_16145 [Sphingomonadaceae bacterium]
MPVVADAEWMIWFRVGGGFFCVEFGVLMSACRGLRGTRRGWGRTDRHPGLDPGSRFSRRQKKKRDPGSSPG